jgi:outer membrane protein assembly factor BamD (BamD/ComL family)
MVRILILVAAATVLVVGAVAQQGPARGPIETPRDPQKEIFAKHNLDVARFYLTRRKAYQGALDRLKEIVEAHPEFSRIDEVIYWIAEANLKLDKRDIAIDYYQKLIKDYPDSEFVKKARGRLEELKADQAGKSG